MTKIVPQAEEMRQKPEVDNHSWEGKVTSQRGRLELLKPSPDTHWPSKLD